MTIEKKKNKIIFTRTFSAPINKVFDAYTSGNYLNNGFILKTHLSQFMILMLRKEEALFMLFKLLR